MKLIHTAETGASGTLNWRSGFRKGGSEIMPDWEGYRQELLGRIGELGKLTPQTLRGYREPGGAGNKTAHHFL